MEDFVVVSNSPPSYRIMVPNQGLILATRGRVAMSRDIFGRHSCGGATDASYIEASKSWDCPHTREEAEDGSRGILTFTV